MRINFELACRVLGARREGAGRNFASGEPEFFGAAVDSRRVTPGQLFICIPGTRVDGHDFAAGALAAGASAILAERMPDNLPEDAPVLLVPDSVEAMGRLAAFIREATKAKVIGITGTAGKTTVKEVLAGMLALHGKTAKNPLNLNNRIGMPLSVLNTDGKEVFWILEVGISQTQDMDELGAILRPDMALILNAGRGHAEGLGARNVPYYKARLLRYLTKNGIGLASADYPDLARECRNACPGVLFFSIDGKQAAYRAAYSGQIQSGRGLYRLWLDGISFDVETPFRGRYGAENTVAIAATAHLAGLGQDEITRGFAEARLPEQRFARRSCGSWLVIDDSYNANPLSCRRMLEAARETAQSDPLVCVMGEMGELGENAEAEHEELGRTLAEVAPKAIFWKGGQIEAVRAGLQRGHFSGAFLLPKNPENFLHAFNELNLAGGLVLFKGSRFNRLEEFVHAFEAGETAHVI